MSQKSLIKGNWATLLLPINRDQSIDWIALQEEIDLFIASKPNGIYTNGTAGEFYNQTEDEFDRTQDLLAQACHRANIPFQIGCSSTNPINTLHRIERTKSLKPRAFQIILPDWVAPSDAEMENYLNRIIECADPIDIVLYNPPHAKKVLQPQDYKYLYHQDIKIAGCKTAGGDQKWYDEMNFFSQRMSVFVPGHCLATGIQQGLHGAYSNVACLNPIAAQRWYESMAEDMEAALELQDRIQKFILHYIVPLMRKDQRSNQAADKLLAAVGGWGPVSLRLRWPYIGFDQSEVLPLRSIAQNLLPEFF